MNYSDKPGNVRCDLFKLSGKWMYTIVLVMDGYWQTVPRDAVKLAWRDQFQSKPESFRDLVGVVLEPYCEHSYPIMFKVSEISQ
jgi:hypothetical protein